MREHSPKRACPPASRVLLAAPSVPEFVVAYLGIQAAGCVVVPVNTMSTRPETEYVLADAGAALAIVWHELGPAIGDAASALDIPAWTLAPDAATPDAEPVPVVERSPRTPRSSCTPRAPPGSRREPN